MDRLDAQGLLIGLGQERLVDTGHRARLQRRPLAETAQTPRGRLLVGASLFDQKAQATPDIDRPVGPEREHGGLPFPQEPLEHSRRGEEPAFSPQGPKMLERRGDGMVGPDALGRIEAMVPAASRRLEGVELDITAGIQRGSQRRDERQAVARIVDRPQRRQHIDDLLGVVDECSGGDAIADALCLERCGEERQRGTSRQQHRDVAELGRTPDPTVRPIPALDREPIRRAQDGPHGPYDVVGLNGAQLG